MRVAVVTGVGRRAGIGFAIVRRLLDDGYRVLAHAWPAAEAAVRDELGPELVWVEADFADPDAPQRVIDAAIDAFGGVDVLVANHARDSAQSLDAVTAEELDVTFAVNARAVVLLVKAFAAQGRRDGRVVLFTSGQHLGAMAGELPYAISKGAVHQMTRSLSAAVAGQRITVNAVNPGPVDTGWPSDELRDELRSAFPAGRWGRPEDIAPVVAWLASADSGWVTGQVIDAEGGFRR
ncbi:MAG TPA: SDR family oxidoreductase [Solirubrobacteraceae bacterium]|nr:SDR family oxidoreductase [Solirubrobacteraceae bacterium]